MSEYTGWKLFSPKLPTWKCFITDPDWGVVLPGAAPNACVPLKIFNVSASVPPDPNPFHE